MVCSIELKFGTYYSLLSHSYVGFGQSKTSFLFFLQECKNKTKQFLSTTILGLKLFKVH